MNTRTSKVAISTRTHAIVLLAIFIMALSCRPSYADNKESKANDRHSPTLNWIIKTRNYWGKVIGDTSQRLDAFFAGEEIIEETNNSFLKLSLAGQQSKSGHSKLIPKAKFRLELPTLEEKLRITIENQPSEKQSVEEKTRAHASQKLDKDDDRAIGAIDLALHAKRHWKASTGVGVKFDIPLNPFWRAKTRGLYQLNDDWKVTAHESIYYFHKDGWGAQSSLAFDRQGPWFVFRQSTQGRYEYDSRRWEIGHTYSFMREISAIRAINYQVGMISETQPEVQATGYFVQAIYRRKLHKEWFFYELVPEFFYPKTSNWKLTPSLTLKFEIVLSATE